MLRGICWVATVAFPLFSTAVEMNAGQVISVMPHWGNVIAVSKTNVSIQVCPEPPMRRDRPLHDKLFKALHDLNADYPRLEPWTPYPKISVAELKAPENGKTFWDFTLMDQMTEDFMKATAGHPVVFAFGTAPAWMYKTDKPTPYPDNPDEITWTYALARRITDSTIGKMAEYQGRLAGWYIKGGFTDEVGAWHESGHHYKIDYWEVLNEPDVEHFLSPADYTRFYDAIVESVRKVAPAMKFMGPALAGTTSRLAPPYLSYFLDPRRHKPGIPIDMISYHYYSGPDPDERDEVMTYTIFHQADQFLTAVGYIDEVRQRYRPQAKVAVDELGSGLPDPMASASARPIAQSYWMMAGGMWAYVYGHLASLNVDVANAAELIDYPGQFPALTLVDWNTGNPNAHYWVVKLLRENFGPGDKVVRTVVVDAAAPADPDMAQLIHDLPGSYDIPSSVGELYGQAFITARGQRRVLLVNKREKAIKVSVVGAKGGTQQIVEQSTAASPSAQPLLQDTLHLPPLAVVVVTWPGQD